MSYSSELLGKLRIKVRGRVGDDRATLCGVKYETDDKGRYFTIPSFCKQNVEAIGYKQDGNEYLPGYEMSEALPPTETAKEKHPYHRDKGLVFKEKA